VNIDKIMNKQVHTCRPDDSLNTAAQLMWERDIGCVPVLDFGGKAIGMITDRDICMSAYITGLPLAAQTVSQAMSKSVHCIRASQSIDAAEALMRSKQVRRLPVTDEAGKVVGIVSLNDLALAAGKEPTRALKPDQLTATLASICQPRANSAARA